MFGSVKTMSQIDEHLGGAGGRSRGRGRGCGRGIEGLLHDTWGVRRLRLGFGRHTVGVVGDTANAALGMPAVAGLAGAVRLMVATGAVCSSGAERNIRAALNKATQNFFSNYRVRIRDVRVRCFIFSENHSVASLMFPLTSV